MEGGRDGGREGEEGRQTHTGSNPDVPSPGSKFDLVASPDSAEAWGKRRKISPKTCEYARPVYKGVTYRFRRTFHWIQHSDSGGGGDGSSLTPVVVFA